MKFCCKYVQNEHEKIRNSKSWSYLFITRVSILHYINALNNICKDRRTLFQIMEQSRTFSLFISLNGVFVPFDEFVCQRLGLQDLYPFAT